MKGLLSLGVLVACLYVTYAEETDQVFKLQTDIKDLTAILVKKKAEAGVLYNNVKKYNADAWKEYHKHRKDVDKFNRDEKTRIVNARKYYKDKTDAKKILDGIKGDADAAVLKKVKDTFQPLFDEYKSFYESKHKEFDNKIKEINTEFDKIVNIEKWIKKSTEELKNATVGDADVDRLQKELYLITRQVQLQQFNEEEKARSDGNSGIKQIRSRYVGSKNYHSSTHTGRSFAAIHDHSNNVRTVGMGEFIGVLNGVEFRTRHNDYRLFQADNSTTLHKTKHIELPAVPPEVLNKKTVDAQVAEMREWFKAFKEQDHSVRDYRKYFKPILCYLEGAWMTKSGDNIDEPFASDRHHIDAKSWFDLQEKILFTSYSGTKSRLENLAHLPTTIMSFTKEGKPVFAQWNYRILCQPVKDIPTKYLKLVLDPASQKMRDMDNAKYEISRSAKFDIEGVDINGVRRDNPMTYTFLDTLMEQIPGKDNAGATISATGFDSEIISANPKSKKNQKLNGAYYHRPYKLKQKDAMGVDSAQRGYSDRFYVAMTTQDRVSAPSYVKAGKVFKDKVSYAIPVEIIYLTPLSMWNPYDMKFVQSDKTLTGTGKKESPFNQMSPRHYFMTPDNFFSGTDTDADAADTTPRGAVWMKGSDGKARAVHASGTRIMFPPINGVEGRIRQRYPIMPIYGEGNSVWKKLNAMEDTLSFTAVPESTSEYYATGISHSTATTTHSHIMELDKADLANLKSGKIPRITGIQTETANGHSHRFSVTYDSSDQKLYISACDTPSNEVNQYCWDNHGYKLSTSSPE